MKGKFKMILVFKDLKYIIFFLSVIGFGLVKFIKDLIM